MSDLALCDWTLNLCPNHYIFKVISLCQRSSIADAKSMLLVKITAKNFLSLTTNKSLVDNSNIMLSHSVFLTVCHLEDHAHLFIVLER